jgi:hypothetical protein
MPDPIDARDVKSLRLVSRYRDRLREILKLAEIETPSSQQQARRHVAALVDELTRDIVRFYDQGTPDSLTPLQRTAVLPALKRLRDILRNSKSSRRGLRDTLLKAAECDSLFANRVS